MRPGRPSIRIWSGAARGPLQEEARQASGVPHRHPAEEESRGSPLGGWKWRHRVAAATFGAMGGQRRPQLWVSFALPVVAFPLLGFFLHFPSLAIWFFVLFRDLVQAKRRKLRKAAEVRSAAATAAGETLGPQASTTTEGPIGRSVEEAVRPVEGGSTGQERREAARPDEEEATASSPPVVEPREEELAAGSPTPLRQVSPPEREEAAILETAESGNPAGSPAEAGAAAPPSPPRDVVEEDGAPQANDVRACTPARSPQAAGGDSPMGGFELEAGSAPPRTPWTLVRGESSLSGARRSSAFSFARSALDGLEAQLVQEEAAPGEASSLRLGPRLHGPRGPWCGASPR